MKLVYLSNSTIPSRDANSVHVMKMSQSFAKNGNETILLAPTKTMKEESNVENIYDYYAVSEVFKVIKIKLINFKILNSVTYAIGSLFFLLKFKPEMVYGRDLLSCYLASFFFKVSYEAHSPMSSNVKVFMLNSLVKRKKFRKLIVISEALKKIILEEQNIDENKILVAHDGSDAVYDFKAKANLKGNNSFLNVGYVGHLYKGRGVDLILKCAKKLVNVNFHLIGGTEEDILYWRDQVKQIDLNNVFFYGFVPPSVTHKYRNSFDILLAPYAEKVSVSGNTGDTSKFMSPLKIFEYMSHGKAIIASDLPVLREVLSEDNAILCDSNDHEAWVLAINRLTDQGLRSNLGQRALEDFEKSYTWLSRAKHVLC